MRLLIVSPCYVPAYRYGGPVKSTHDLARVLASLGVDVTVFTTNANGDDDLPVPLESEVIVDGVKVVYFKVGWPRRYFRSSQLKAALRRDASGFDLVHINWLYVHSSLVAARQCRRSRVPYIISPRGMLDATAISMKGRLKKLAYLRLLEGPNLAGAALVHFTSDGERENALAGPWTARSRVSHLGLDAAHIDEGDAWLRLQERFPALDGERRRVLFLGRLNYIKGLDLLAKAWPEVMRAFSNAHLVIAGPDDDGYGALVEKWLRQNGSLEHATFTGLLLERDKIAAIRHSELCVAPSYLESFGITIVEAMSHAKPVVVTERVNISPEILKAGAGAVVRCDAGELASAICNVLRDPIRALEMGKNARRLVEEKFGLDSAARKLLDIYSEVLHPVADESRSLPIQ